MAITHYARHVIGRQRRPGIMDRREWKLRARELALRGQDLPHSKLLDIDVVSIRSATRQREALLQHIRDNLSNAALAKQYGVHVNSITRVVQYDTWGHVA